MSAIGGFFQTDHSPASSGLLARMAQPLAKGGPDQTDSHTIGPYASFRHLFRTTPEDHFDQQPLTDGPLTLVADARLDNRPDLLRDLALDPATSQRLPDSKLILLAFQKWGHECPSKLIGEFAFAIWHASQRSLFLARDQRGYRPLFYTQTKDTFAFASLPTALFPIPGVPRELDPQTLASYLLLDYTEHATTVFKNIFRLEPAHSLLLRDATPAKRRYWTFDPSRRITFRHDSDYLEAATELLERCVASALRADRPVGAFLSGGLDSSTVACAAANQLKSEGKTLPTFTEAPPLGYPPSPNPRRCFDESPYVEAIAAHQGNLEPHILRPEFLPFLQPDLSDNADLCMPLRNPLNHLWIAEIARVASTQGIRVLLGGQSGNATLSYHGHHNLPRWFKSGQWLKLARSLQTLATPENGGLWGATKSKLIHPLLPAAFIARRQRAKTPWTSYSAIRPEFAARHLSPQKLANATIAPHKNSQTFRYSLLSGFDYIGDLSQLYARSHAIEIRDPLGDLRLLEFCLAIPDDQYLSPENDRWLIRRLTQNLLPESVRLKQTIGLQFANWHHHLSAQKHLIPAEIDLLQTSPLAQELLDLERLQALAQNWPTENWHNSTVTFPYNHLLSRAITAGRFLRWVKSS